MMNDSKRQTEFLIDAKLNVPKQNLFPVFYLFP